MAETRKSTPKEKTAKAKEEMLKDLDKRLDSELADTFPASDPRPVRRPQFMPPSAATPSMTSPAIRKRAVRRKRGGQSAKASLVTLKAELQRTQKAAIRSGFGNCSARRADRFPL
jgi:hypothetical protein